MENRLLLCLKLGKMRGREKRGGMTAAGNTRESFGSDGIALYLDCDDGYVNVHM